MKGRPKSNLDPTMRLGSKTRVSEYVIAIRDTMGYAKGAT